MSGSHLELLILVGVFAVFVWFVWSYIAADLPDDFLGAVRRSRKGQGNGRLRDHG